MQFSQRLNDMEARFDAVTRQMADPAVIADGEAYRKIAKTRSELEEVVAKYQDYKQAKRNYDEARSMVEDPDPELRQMANDEIGRLEPELVRCFPKIRWTKRTSCSKSAPVPAATKPRCSRPKCSACIRAMPNRSAGAWK